MTATVKLKLKLPGQCRCLRAGGWCCARFARTLAGTAAVVVVVLRLVGGDCAVGYVAGVKSYAGYQRRLVTVMWVHWCIEGLIYGRPERIWLFLEAGVRGGHGAVVCRFAGGDLH